MGMAASQARYLGLTARKTNVEYEGQQINQARVALANQSADAFNQYYSLEAPTPPSSENYKTTSYVYTDGGKQYTIESYTLNNNPEDPNFPYVVTISYSDYRYEAAKNIQNGAQIKSNNDTTSIYDDVGNHYPYVIMTSGGLKNLKEVTLQSKLVDNIPDSDINKDVLDSLNNDDNISYDPNKQIWVGITPDNNPKIDAYGTGEENKYLFTYDTSKGGYVASTVTDAEGNTHPLITYNQDTDAFELLNQYKASPSASDTDKIAIQTIKDKYGLTDEVFYSYEQGENTMYISQSDLNAYMSQPYSAVNKLNTYFASNIEYTRKENVNAQITFDPTGSYPTQILIDDGSLNGSVYELSAVTEQDDVAYNEAMKDYEYQCMVYQQTIEEINAKTEMIQQQDKMLELKLRQLDTEQEALQTEMESVKKVIDKNIESTFKTFQ